MANPIQGLKINTNIALVKQDFDDLINHINKSINKPFNLNFNINQIQQQMSQIATEANKVREAMNFSVTVGNNDNINTNLKQLDSYKERTREIAGETEKLNQTVLAGVNEIGQAVKITNTLNEETGKITQTVRESTNEYKKQRQEIDKLAKQNKSVEESIQIQIKSLQNRAELLKKNYWTGDFNELDKFTSNLDASNIDKNNYKTELADLKNQYQTIANTIQESHRNNLASLQKEVELESQKNASTMQNWARQLEIDAEQRKFESDRIKNQMEENAQLNKETSEIEKQLALYKEQLKIKDQNLRTTYGKSYDTEGMSSILTSAGNLKASDFNSVSELRNATKQLDLQVEKSTANMKTLRKESTLAMKESDGFFTTLTKDFGKMAAWSLVGGALFGSIRELKQGIEDVIELDDTLNDLRMDMMDTTKAEFDNLILSSRELSIAIGTNVTDIDAMLKVYSNANTTVDEIMQKTRAAAILSNISDMSASESVDAIQSIMLQFSQFKNSTDDLATQATHISDVLASVAQSLNLDFKSGIQSISEAVKVSGEVINEAGISYEKYAAIVGKTAEISRLSGSTIGNAMKTIASRISRANSGDASDEDISKAEKAYKSIGIALRDDTGNFKDLDLTLTALSEKWSSLNSVQRSYIAEQSAGVRQKSIFIDMMNNYAQSTKMATDAIDSQGLANAKNSVFLDSITSKLRILGTEMKSMFQTGINSDSIKGLLDTAIKLVDTFGNLHTVIAYIGTGLAIFKGNDMLKFFTSLPDKIKTSVTSMQLYQNISKVIQAQQMGLITTNQAVGLSFTALGTSIKTAFMSNPIGWIAIGITAVISAIDIFNQRVEENSKKLQEHADSIQQEIESIKGLKESLSVLSDNTTEKSKLAEVNASLAETYPELISYYNAESGQFEISIQKLEELIKKKEELAMIDNANNIDNARKVVEDTQKAIDEARDKLQSGKILKDQGSAGSMMMDMTQEDRQRVIDYIEKQQKKQSEANKVANQGIKLINDKIKELKEEGYATEQINKKLLEYSYSQEAIDFAIKQSTESLNNYTKSINDNSATNQSNALSQEKIQEKMDKLSQSYGKQAEKVADYNKFLEELDENGKLSSSSVNKILGSYNDLLQKFATEPNLHDAIKKALGEETKARDSLAEQIAWMAVQGELSERGLTGVTIEETRKRILAIQQEIQAASLRGQVNPEDFARMQQLENIIRKVDSIKGSILKTTDKATDTYNKSTKSEVSDLDLKIDRYQKINGEIDKLNSLLEYNKTLSEESTGQDQISYLQKQIDLYTQLREKVSQRYTMEKEEAKSLYSTLSKQGVKFDATGEITNANILEAKQKAANLLKGDAKEKAKKAVEELSQSIERYSDLIHNIITGSSEEWHKLGSEINSINEDIKSAYESKLEIVKTVESKIQDMMKQSVEDQKTQLDEQLSDYEKYINDKIALLDDLTAKEEYEKNLNKQQQTVQEIQNKINEVSLDDSLEGRSKLADLQKQLAEEQDNLASMQSDREKELRKQNLEDALATEQERVQAQKDSLDKLWSDEQINIKARQALLDGYYTDAQGKVVTLTEAYVTFENKVGEGLTTLGEQIKSDFLTQLKQAREIMKDISGIMSKINGTTSTTLPVQGSYADGGIINYTGLAAVHGSSSSPEMVLNTSQISKLFSFINNLGVVKTPALAGAGVGGGIHFDNLINVEGSVDEKVIPDLRIITDNVLQKLESIIYKRGSSRV